MNDLSIFDGQAWAMEELALRRFLARAGETSRLEVKLEAGMLPQRQRAERRLDVGVVPLFGVLGYRPSPFEQFLGMTSVLDFMADLRAMASDRSVESIVILSDTPGGSVDGIQEASDLVRRVGRSKRVTAIADTLMCSAGYHICSGAAEIVATPSALVGSIGVYSTLYSFSKANERLGIDVALVKAGKFKAEGHRDMPIDDSTLAHVQESIDYSYFQFVRDVATGRRTTPSAVRTGYGEGRALDPHPALGAGLVDRIATLEAALAGAARAVRHERAEFEAERDRRAAAGQLTPQTRQRMRERRLALRKGA